MIVASKPAGATDYGMTLQTVKDAVNLFDLQLWGSGGSPPTGGCIRMENRGGASVLDAGLEDIQIPGTGGATACFRVNRNRVQVQGNFLGGQAPLTVIKLEAGTSAPVLRLKQAPSRPAGAADVEWQDSNGTLQGALYVENGALVFKGRSGTVTTIAPA